MKKISIFITLKARVIIPYCNVFLETVKGSSPLFCPQQKTPEWWKARDAVSLGYRDACHEHDIFERTPGPTTTLGS